MLRVPYKVYDTFDLTRIEPGQVLLFFGHSLSTGSTEAVTNLRMPFSLENQTFEVTRISVIADALPMGALELKIMSVDYERGTLEQFHRKIGYSGYDLMIPRVIYPFTPFHLNMRFFNLKALEGKYNIRVEFAGYLWPIEKR